MNIFLQLLGGLLYVCTLFSAVSVMYGVFPLLFGRGEKGTVFGGWLLNIGIFVVSVLGLFALGFPDI